MKPPLSGIRVLDLTNVLSGPFCCHQLVHMGAEVIKVEIPGSGDLARQLGADPTLNEKDMGISFLAQNPGKKSITVNLKSPEGKEILRKLVKTSDVLVENFRPGVMDRLGVGFEKLKQENSTLIYCAISGFGQDGPMKGLPAYDQIIQGISGVMSITGSKETAPYRVGYPLCDTIGGMTAAFAIAAALADHNREHARFIDVSMLEATMATMGWVVSNHLIGGIDPMPLGNDNFTSSPSGTFKTCDKEINIAANKQEHFESICHIIERVELITDPRFSVRQSRLENRVELTKLLENSFQNWTANDLLDTFKEAGVPAGPVNSIPDILADPQIRDRGMIATYENVADVHLPVKVLRPGFKINGKAPSVETPPPTLGEHTQSLMKELGYGDDKIEKLHSEGVI
ncbi:CaiB/BaiF CoA transferase family protein [Kiloniella sp.]|uniref:CaiB/BaiF CoA transferase family protein n=1 Tax=Kiloniella sp. TaxID=1938587 RepID=UPI003B02E5BD